MTTPEAEPNSAGNDATQLVLTVEQAAQRLGIGRTHMYALVSAGEVRSVHIGRLRRIPVQALHEYVDRLLNAA